MTRRCQCEIRSLCTPYEAEMRRLQRCEGFEDDGHGDCVYCLHDLECHVVTAPVQEILQ